VEVRDTVFLEVHLDHYTIEPRNDRHDTSSF
jgi:hypothetical protein